MGLMFHQSMDQAEQQVLANIRAAKLSGTWMVAVFRVLPTGKVVVHRTTYEFPKNKFLEAIDVLGKNIEEEVSFGSLPVDPLPFAKLPSITKAVEEAVPAMNPPIVQESTINPTQQCDCHLCQDTLHPTQVSGEMGKKDENEIDFDL